MQELNNVIQLADNIHRHVTLATKDMKLPSQKYVSFVSGHYVYWWRLFLTNVHNAQDPERISIHFCVITQANERCWGPG
jgi:hypothetical protein